MMTDNELREQLKLIRDKAMDGDCNYSEKQSLALQKIMDAIDHLT